MLVLTRKATQQIQVGENIVITILQVKGNSVRVGIEAPRDIRVLRGELRDEEPGRPAPETVIDEEVTIEAAETAMSPGNRVRSASTSSRQAPLDLGRFRDLRQSVVMRIPVAEACTDAPTDRETRHRPSRTRELLARR